MKTDAMRYSQTIARPGPEHSGDHVDCKSDNGNNGVCNGCNGYNGEKSALYSNNNVPVSNGNAPNGNGKHCTLNVVLSSTNGEVYPSLDYGKNTIFRPAPFSHDDEAVLERQNCDYSKITYEQAMAGETSRRVRVYADGIYDLFHQGHARQLMQAKNVFRNVYLIVGVCSDEMTHSRKGRTVMTGDERYEALRHCRYVDEVVTDAPWTLEDDFLASHKIDFVAHDDLPYTTGSAVDVYHHIKERGMFVTTERTEGVSTSDVVSRIVKDYDIYVRRNLARGYSAKDLNVGFINEKKYRLQNKLETLKRRSQEVLADMEGRKTDLLTKWEEKSRDFIDTFLTMFGRDGRLTQYLQEKKDIVAKAISPPGSPVASSSDEEPPAKSRRLSRHVPSDEDCSDNDDPTPRRRRSLRPHAML